MSVELQKIKDRIRALMAKTTDAGATEAEAMAAMEKAGQLLDMYDIEMLEVFEEKPSAILKTTDMMRAKWDIMSKVSVQIANFCDCFTYYGWIYENYKKVGIKVNYIGFEQDVDMAIYLFEMIRKSIDDAAQEFKNTSEYELAAQQYGGRRHAFTVFKDAMGGRIGARLREEKAKRQNPKLSDGTSLISLKVDEAKKEYQRRTGRKAKYVTSYGKRVYNQDAAAAGHHAGNKVNFNRPIKNTGDNSFLLGN